MRPTDPYLAYCITYTWSASCSWQVLGITQTGFVQGVEQGNVNNTFETELEIIQKVFFVQHIESSQDLGIIAHMSSIYPCIVHPPRQLLAI